MYADLSASYISDNIKIRLFHLYSNNNLVWTDVKIEMKKKPELATLVKE
jgi:hypothetical protein